MGAAVSAGSMVLPAALALMALAVVWTYAGYPALLLLLARRRPARRVEGTATPTVSIIVSAYNEEKHLGGKLQNLLALDYPRNRLEIIVVSDASTDRTNDIAKELGVAGVRVIVLPARHGKTACQNAGARAARGAVLVFTDVTTTFPIDAVRRLVAPFADPRVGCVGAELSYVSAGGTAVGHGGSLYWRYERWLKGLESRVNSLIGVSGALYAVRAAVYAPIAPDLISDFTIALDVFARGYVTVYAAGVGAAERTHEDGRREFEMRLRVIVRTIHALVRNAGLLNPVRYGFFAGQLWSHKVLRYLVPELLLGILAASAALAVTSPSPLFQGLVAAQVLGYAVVPLLYLACRRLGVRARALAAPFYFLHANAAALWAQVCYLRGQRYITWTTVRE